MPGIKVTMPSTKPNILIVMPDQLSPLFLPIHGCSVVKTQNIDALAAIGRMDEARDIFETLLERRNHLGLLSEDLAFDNGEAWGNFPQTYSHVGLITAAMRLSRSWQEAS